MATNFRIAEATRSDIRDVHVFMNLPNRPISLAEIGTRIALKEAFVARELDGNVIGFAYVSHDPMIVSQSEAALSHRFDGFEVKRQLDVKVKALAEVARASV